jgi:hypothetical protein
LCVSATAHSIIRRRPSSPASHGAQSFSSSENFRASLYEKREMPMKWRLLTQKQKNNLACLTRAEAKNSAAPNDAEADAGRRLTLTKKLCTGGRDHRVDGHQAAQNARIGGVTDSQRRPRAPPSPAHADVFLLSRAAIRKSKKVDGILPARRVPSGSASNALVRSRADAFL